MQKQDICCIKCRKFLLTEQKDDQNRIRCVAGSYENGFYQNKGRIPLSIQAAG